MAITTTIDWPKELGCTIMQDGYSLKPVSPLLRTDLESGRARQRRKYTSTPMVASFNFLFTETQYMLFDGFFKHILTDGVSWFNMPLKVSIGYANYVCRFTDIYSEATVTQGRYWNVSAELEIWERPVIGKSWVEVAPGFLMHADIFDITMNREWPEA